MAQTRAEHIAWAKQRALEYVDGGRPADAISSIFSDLNKHEETKGDLLHVGMTSPTFARLGCDISEWTEEVRKWIEGIE